MATRPPGLKRALLGRGDAEPDGVERGPAPSGGLGRTTLDKGGLAGETNQTLARVQWVY